MEHNDKLTEHLREYDGKPTPRDATEFATMQFISKSIREEFRIPKKAQQALPDLEVGYFTWCCHPSHHSLKGQHLLISLHQIYIHIFHYQFICSNMYGQECHVRTKWQKTRIEPVCYEAREALSKLLTYLLEQRRLDLFVTALKWAFYTPGGYISHYFADRDIFARLILRASQVVETKRQRLVLHWLNESRAQTKRLAGPEARFNTRLQIAKNFLSIGDHVHSAEVTVYHEDVESLDNDCQNWIVVPRERIMQSIRASMKEITMAECPWLFGRMCLAMLRMMIWESQAEDPRQLIKFFVQFEACERLRLGPNAFGPEGVPNHLYELMQSWCFKITSMTAKDFDRPDVHNLIIWTSCLDSLWTRIPPSVDAAPAIADKIATTSFAIGINPVGYDSRLTRAWSKLRMDHAERIVNALDAFRARPMGRLGFWTGTMDLQDDYMTYLHRLCDRMVDYARWHPNLAERVRLLEAVEQKCRQGYEDTKLLCEKKKQRAGYDLTQWAYRIVIAGAYHPNGPQRLEDSPEWTYARKLIQLDWFPVYRVLDEKKGLTEAGQLEKDTALALDEKLKKTYDSVRGLDRSLYTSVVPHLDWVEMDQNMYYDGTLSGGRQVSMDDFVWLARVKKLVAFQSTVKRELSREVASYGWTTG
jgi:hypothetical protein